ncbi:unnamed protein product, partial [Meganyctiphanes norvegica]
MTFNGLKHQCGKAFSQNSHLKYYIKECTLGRNHINAANVVLIKHQRTHTGAGLFRRLGAQCDRKCDKVFSHKQENLSHKTSENTLRREITSMQPIMHTGEKPYQCRQCDKVFSHKQVLIKHQRTHTGEKPYQCSQCDKTFSRKKTISIDLIIHQRTHTGKKPYQCRQCDKTFSHKQVLIKHQRTHTGEKPYQ